MEEKTGADGKGVVKTPVNPDFLPAPVASFNRALEVRIGEHTLLTLSGTASVGPELQTVCPDDFEGQVEQTYKNIIGILSERGFSLYDIIKWRVYLKDINKHYDAFNRARDSFFRNNNITRDNVGASVCVQAKLCREELLVEIEAEALKKTDSI